jgi:hypothetical protein
MQRVLAGVVLVVGVGLVGLACVGGLLGRDLHRFVAQFSTADAKDSALNDVLASLRATPLRTLQCASQAPLKALEEPGAVWERHRHALELNRPYIYDRSAYRIGNLRTGPRLPVGIPGAECVHGCRFRRADDLCGAASRVGAGSLGAPLELHRALASIPPSKYPHTLPESPDGRDAASPPAGRARRASPRLPRAVEGRQHPARLRG